MIVLSWPKLEVTGAGADGMPCMSSLEDNHGRSDVRSFQKRIVISHSWVLISHQRVLISHS